MSDRASVKIQTHGIGGTKVIINGKELEGIKAIHFSELPGIAPELLISLQTTDLTISGEVMEDSLVFSKCHTDPKGPPGIPGKTAWKFNSSGTGTRKPVKGETGMSGPTSYTHFEIKGEWTEKHVELDNLCLKVLDFLQKNPEIASVVEITKDAMTSKL